MGHFLHKTGKYAIAGYSHKLGLLLHGPPGTGKTSLVKVRKIEFPSSWCWLRADRLHQVDLSAAMRVLCALQRWLRGNAAGVLS